MAREHARIYVSIWDDEDFCDLPASSQWLYLHLTSCESLNYAGVADWRPGRIAARTGNLSGQSVEVAAAVLEEEHYLLVDRDTEEALVRSFIRNDGLMASPNVARAMVKARGAVSSKALRAVIVHELQRLQEDQPDLRGWTRPEVQSVLSKRSMPAWEALAQLPPNPTAKGSPKGSDNPFTNRSDNRSAGPSPTPNSLLPSTTSVETSHHSSGSVTRDHDETPSPSTRQRKAG